MAKKKSKKAKTEVATTEVAVPEVAVAPVVAAPEVAAPAAAESDIVNSVVDGVAAVAPAAASDCPMTTTINKLNDFGKRINELTLFLTSLKVEYKNLEKSISKEIKIAQKHYSKGKKSSTKREPTGFVKPTRISAELAEFLNRDIGVELARMVVSKEIHNYIKSNGLSKGRIINPDPALAKILNYTEGVDVPVSYLNLQRFLKHHFVSSAANVAAAAAAAAAVSV